MSSASFSAVLDSWQTDPNPESEYELGKSFRSAWAEEDADERFAVLSYILRFRRIDAMDLVIDGVRTGDAYLAPHAVATSIVLLAKGAVHTMALEPALHDFMESFPEWRVLAAEALRRLRASSS
jgi:hypothetical protein